MPEEEKEYVVILKDGKKWKVKTKNGKFKEAKLDDNKMKAKCLEDVEVDTSKMQTDANNHPNIPGVEIADKKGPPYLYCLPLRNSANQIIWWTCGGNGPYICPCP
jgi:hypothetical protein